MDCSPPGLCPWDFPGKNTGVGCHFLLQGTFLTQGSNPWLLPLLLHCRQILYCWATKELPEKSCFFFKLPSLYYLSWQPLQTHTQSISSVQFSRSVMSLSLQPHESQHARPACASPTPGVHSDSRPSSQWCHPAMSSSVVPFSSCPRSLPASQSFPMSQLFAWGGQSTGVSALVSFLPKKSQGWSPLSPSKCSCVRCLAGGQGQGVIRNV